MSTIYLALTLPHIDYHPELGMSNLGSWRWIVWLFVAPTGIGLALALSGSFLHNLLVRIGLSPVHPIPTAWDWKFSNINKQWVLVTLTDGSQVAGHLGSGSFVSSDPTERDIYIEKVYSIDPDTETWQETGDSGILIAPGQVQTIEFWSYDTRQELKNED